MQVIVLSKVVNWLSNIAAASLYISVISLYHKLTVVTRNDKDFNIDDLNVISPWHDLEEI